MNAVLDAPADAAPRRRSRGARGALPARSAVGSLARVEGRRLVRNPLFLLATLGGVTLFVGITWRDAPTLQLDAILSGAALLPMAAATFAVANLAAFRSHRHDTEELYDGLVITRAQRTTGHLLSVAWAVAAALVVLAVEGVYLLVLRPTGLPNPFELITGPVTVALLGCAGVLLGRLVRSAVAAPVALVAFASGWVFADLRSGAQSGPIRWLTPWVPAPTNPELLIRPAALHLLYLIALILLVSAVVELRDGRGGGVRGVALATAGIVMLSGWAVTRPPSPAARAKLVRLMQDPLEYEDCAQFGGIRYCAYPGYRGWVRRWDEVVQSTLAPVPASARPHDLELNQVMNNIYDSDLPYVYLRHFGTAQGSAPRVGDAITPGAQWGRGRWEGQYQLGLGLQVAARTLGYPSPAAFDFNVNGCRAGGQAKAVVAIWLAAQATAGSGAALHAANVANPWGIEVEHQTPGAGSSGSSGFSYSGPDSYLLASFVSDAVGGSLVDWGRKEAGYAEQLLAQPHAQVASVLAAHWQELTDATTPTVRIVDLFGLRPLPTLREQLEQAGATPDVVHQFLHSFVSGLHPCP